MSRPAMRGAALVLVLWLIVLMASVIGAFALTARVEQLQTHVGVDALRGSQLAQAGLEYALYRQAQSAQPGQPAWISDGRSYPWQFGGAQLQLSLLSESAKVDINQADAGLLAALMQQLGAEPQQAQRLAAAIVDWRDSDELPQPLGAEKADYAAAGLPYGPSNDAFASLEELRRVLAMPAPLFQAMRPHLTLWTQRSQPEPMLASDVVLRAMGIDPVLQHSKRQAQLASGNALASAGDTFSIQSRVQLADDRSVVVDAVVRLGGSDTAAAAYTVLHWQQGMGTQ